MKVEQKLPFYNTHQNALLVSRANYFITQYSDVAPALSTIVSKILAQQQRYNLPEYILQLVQDGCVDKDFVGLNQQLQILWKKVHTSEDPMIFNYQQDVKAIQADIKIVTNSGCYIDHFALSNDQGSKFARGVFEDALGDAIVHRVARSLLYPELSPLDGICEIGLQQIKNVATVVVEDSANIHKGELDGIAVAVKVFYNLPLCGLTLFENEVSMHKHLASEYVVSPIGISSFKKARYIVMEFMPNFSLRRYLSEPDQKLLPLKKRVSLALQVARGIQFLHSKKVLFIEFNSKKVLLDENFNCKFTGLSCCATFDKLPNILDEERKFKIIYIAEEVWRRTGEFSVESDIYSLGIVLWEILSGQVYWEYYNGDIAPWENMKPVPEKAEISDNLANLIKSCCAPSPDQRPSIDAIISTLNGCA